MADFTFRKKKYRLERGAYQFTLSELTGKEYVVEGYYSDVYYVIKKLISLHAISLKDGKEMLNTIHSTCNDLGKVINKAVKRSESSQVERSIES